MDARGASVCTPLGPGSGLPVEPILGLKSGYVMRSIDALPKQGASAPWRLHQNYIKDVRLLRHGGVEDAMDFSAPAERPRGRPQRAPATDSSR